jgi:CheY-like chemotaxis protein
VTVPGSKRGLVAHERITGIENKRDMTIFHTPFPPLNATSMTNLHVRHGSPRHDRRTVPACLDSGHHRDAACLIADIRMPGVSGLDLQARLNAEHRKIPTIFITADDDEAMRHQAIKSRCSGVRKLSIIHDVQQNALTVTVRA